MTYDANAADVSAALGPGPLYSVSSVARFLGKSRNSILLCGIKTIRDGKRRKITRAALIDFLEGKQ